MNASLHLTLLGAPHMRLGTQLLTGFTTNKAQALLFYLAVTAHTGAPHSREAIATLLWGEMADAQAKQNLRAVLPELRRLVGDYLLIDRQTVAFQATSACWLDVAALRQALASPPTVANRAERQAAVDLYQGEFLHGFFVRDAPLFDAWVVEQREALHALVVKALSVLVDEYAQAGDIASALTANRRLLQLEPWSEPAHRQQMVLLTQSGERAAALAQYETCRRILASEFGIEPLAETTALYEQIRRGEVGKPGDQRDRPGSTDQLPHAEPASGNEQGDSALPAGNSGLRRQDAQPLPVAGYGLPQRTKLYGRQADLLQLQKWIAEDGARLVGILGIGGQGKSALAATFARLLAESTPPEADADHPASGSQLARAGVWGVKQILWRSLLNAPPLAEVMQEWLYLLSGQTITSLPNSLDQQLNLLFDYLQGQRCLLILDNLESILQGEGLGSAYRAGYESYGQLLRQLVEREHRSCLLLTSREAPQELNRWAEDTPSVRCLSLAGLPAAAGRQLLQARGVSDDEGGLAALVAQYSGNPLALKLAAETVQEIFAGDVAAFLQAESLVFDDIRTVLDQQFARLAPLERELLTWLAILREPT
ncbi:MAG TPA: BTAD domain-containing putative transcriptional regulator, partial [Caldilineaceae bacterium]|nr:BTAD domain-containing putative transcriptional regulator [Caldilineaceae bacterium]